MEGEGLNPAIAALQNHVLLAAVVCIAAVVTTAWCAVHLTPRSMRWSSLAALTVWAVAIALIALQPLPTTDGFRGVVNLMPGRTILAGLTGSSLDRLQLLGNLLLLTPFGALARFVLPLTRRGVIALSVAIAVSIELAQWLLATGRSCDIDDVIMNALGATLALQLMETFTRRRETHQSTTTQDADEQRA